MKPSLDTTAVHGATLGADGSRKPRPFDAIPSSIVPATAFAFSSVQEVCDLFDGKIARDEYGRFGNPTVRSAEAVLGALEGAEEAALFGSGMAAMSTVVFALLKTGDHVVLTSDCYKRTRQLVTDALGRFGVTSSLVAPDDKSGMEKAAATPGARLMITEVPSNPFLRVPDLEWMASLCKERGMKLVVDATFATPVNLRPLTVGADLVVHSATKYLGGHNDLLAGSVAGSRQLLGPIRNARALFGGVLDPHAAYLLERGLKTLGLRLERQNHSAMAIACSLEGHPQIERVYHPGLPSHPDHALAKRLLSGFGGMVTFVVKGGLRGAMKFVDALRIPLIAPSLGGVESLVQQPALMSFYELSAEERAAIGIPDGLVRLSVGIEDPVDLLADIDHALSVASET